MIRSPRNRFIMLTVSSYLLLALAWILLSDRLLVALTDKEFMIGLSMVKGIFFVLASSAFFALALSAIPATAPQERDTLLGSMASGVAHGKPPRWLIYGFAIVISLSVLLLRLMLPVELNEHPMLIIFMLPIILSALVGGLGPGLTSTLITALSLDFATHPHLHHASTPSYVQLQWAMLGVNGAAVSLLSALLRHALARQAVHRRLLHSVVSGSSDAIFVKDRQGRYLLANAAAAGFAGRTPAELIGLNDDALFAPLSVQDLQKQDQCILAAEQTQTHRDHLTLSNGQAMTFLVTKGPVFNELGAVMGLFGIYRDITQDQALAEQLRASEERLQLLIDATSDAFWDWDLVRGEVYRSPRYYQVTGYAPEEDTHDYAFFERMVHPLDLPLVQQSIQEHRQNKTSSLDIEFRLMTHSGELKWMRVMGRAVSRDLDGTALRLLGSLTDISEHKRMDADLSFVLNEAADAIWVTDPSGHFLFANPAACRLTGHSRTELQHMALVDLLAPTSQTELAEHFAQLASQPSLRREWQLRNHKQEIITVELSTARMQDGRYMAFGRDRSEQKRAEQALQDRERRLARVLEGSEQGYWDWDLQHNSFQVSPRWEAMLGYQAGEMDVSMENWSKIVQADDLAVAQASIQRHLQGLTPCHEVELRCRTKSGSWRWILSRGRVVEWSEEGQPLIMSGTHTDITERKLLEQAQKEAAVVFDSSYEGIMVVTPNQQISKVNAAFTRITGYRADEVLGFSPSILASGRQDAHFYQEMWSQVHQHGFWRGELWNKRKSGELYVELLSISVVRDAQDEIQYYVGIFSDITQLKEHEAELDRVAYYDALTGIPNRRLLTDRLEQAILHAKRHEHSCAVCFLDLDSFKSINDLYGHATGDQLLVAITNRLRSALRAEDTLARLGGDEFVLLLSDLHSLDECTLILERVLATIQLDTQCGEHLLRITASIGVSLYPEDNADPDTLLRHADQAMYFAKNAGKNRYQLFDPISAQRAQSHRRQLETLGQALLQEEFVLYYQPKVDLNDGTLCGVEALIRWQHPERGLLPPAEFLPFIEGSHLETNFGEWVLHTALAQAALWLTQGLTIPISVNISANHLLTAGFAAFLQTLLLANPEINPALLELEVLESAAIADIDQAIVILQRCRQLGVHFSLDDFGTGYSSLTYLRKLPIDTLKIDQSFVRNMLIDSDDLGIVESVIQLANAFNRQVIAEGVESREHGLKLRELGCRFAQGYGIARPMPAEQLPAWYQHWQTELASRFLAPSSSATAPTP